MKGFSGEVVQVGHELSGTGRSRELYAVVKIRVSRSRSEAAAERQLQRLVDELHRRRVSIFPLTEALK